MNMNQPDLETDPSKGLNSQEVKKNWQLMV